MPFTVHQQMSIAIAPKFTAALSVLSSLCIIRAVGQDMKAGTAKTHQRLLLGMSCFDVVGSFAQFLTTWPIPRGTPGVWGAMGNQVTCTLQGLMLQMIGAPPVYNASLAIYYLLRSRYDWNDASLRKVEPYMHAVPIVYSLGAAVASLPLKLFNNANFWCWVAPFPQDCKDTFRFGDDANCVRGDNAWFYRLIFLYVEVWASMLVNTVSMVLIYCTVLHHEKAVDSLQHDGTVIRRQSRRVANQAFWYMMAFYVVWVPASILRLVQAIPGATLTFPHAIITSCCNPTQGLLNFIIFFRARFLQQQRDNPNHGLLKQIRRALFPLAKETTDHTGVNMTATDKIFNIVQSDNAAKSSKINDSSNKTSIEENRDES